MAWTSRRQNERIAEKNAKVGEEKRAVTEKNLSRTQIANRKADAKKSAKKGALSELSLPFGQDDSEVDPASVVLPGGLPLDETSNLGKTSPLDPFGDDQFGQGGQKVPLFPSKVPLSDWQISRALNKTAGPATTGIPPLGGNVVSGLGIGSQDAGNQWGVQPTATPSFPTTATPSFLVPTSPFTPTPSPRPLAPPSMGIGLR